MVLERLRVRYYRALERLEDYTGRGVAKWTTRYDLNQLQRFEAVLNRHGRSWRAFSSILEFGCGFGRLVRHLFRVVPGAAIAGCDVLPEAIRACQRWYSQGRFFVNHWAPPLPMPQAQFDLIYSYSVFTHLSEATHQAWLKDLARVLKPGGFMVHTVHSHEYLRRAALFSPESLEKYGVNGSVEPLLCVPRPYLYVVANPHRPEYGHTIMSQDYVRMHWPQYTGMDVVDYVVGAIEAYPEGCQDLVVLRKAAA